MTFYRYAAYGSNLHPLRLQRRCPSARLVGTASVDGLELRFNKRGWADGSGKCNINSGSGSIFVAVFDIRVGERALLDRYEGLGNGYDSTELVVPGLGTCSTYVAQPDAIDEALRPLEWYKQLVLLGCRFHRLPDFYVSAIENTFAVIDDNSARDQAHRQIIADIRAAS